MTRVAILAIATLCFVAAPARADDPATIVKMRFTERGKDLTVTTTIAQLFDSAAYEALGSGFPSTVVIRTWVYEKRKTEPVGFQLLQRRVVYDLWDDVYTVRLDGPGGRRTIEVKERSRAFTLLTSIEAVPIAALSQIPYEQHHVLAIVAELNPVSRETLAEVRRWLSQGTGGGGLDRGPSFFGSFVSVFVNPKIPEADRVLRIRSQPFYRPRPRVKR